MSISRECKYKKSVLSRFRAQQNKNEVHGGVNKKARRETGFIMTDEEAIKLLHQPSMFLNRDGM